MKRKVILFLMLFLLYSCGGSGDAFVRSGAVGMLNRSAGDAAAYARQRKLLELVVRQKALHSNDTYTIGPVELLGNNGTMDSCCRPLFSDFENSAILNVSHVYNKQHSPGGDSALMLVHYSYTHESDTTYEVTEGTVCIPVPDAARVPVSTIILDHLPFRHNLTKGARRIILNIDNLLL